MMDNEKKYLSMKDFLMQNFLALICGICIGCILCDVLSACFATPVYAGPVQPSVRIDSAPFMVECTAYCDEGITKSGKPTVPNCTIAGAEEWLGCACIMWDEDWNFIGIFEFTDTGYGKDGDIKRGETVDIFIPNYDMCIEWGRRDVYIQIIKGVG